MSALLRHEPVVNRQKAITAARLIVRANSTAEAVAALDAVATTWPARPVLVSLVGCACDSTWLDWKPPANAMLELPGELLATPAGAELAGKLDAAGIAICIDDFGGRTLEPGLPKLRYALADAQRHPRAEGAPGVPLAKGLADHLAFGDAVENGYSGAAGWFFLKGLPLPANKLNPSHAKIIHVLNLVRQNAETGDVEAAMKQDLSLSFKLLRYINSAGFGLATHVESFRHAVTLIGYNKLNKWLSLLLVTASSDPSAPALTQAAIARGRFMELATAGRIDKSQLDNLFIAGSFSLLDVLLGTQLDTVLAEMKLPETIVDALLRRTGPYAPFLDLALTAETEDFAAIETGIAALGIEAGDYNRALVESLVFADSLQAG